MTRPMTSRRIVMFVYNPCRTDPRVLKEARTLAVAGHDVTVIAVADGIAAPEERRDGFVILRIRRDPPHYKLLRWLRRGRRMVRCAKRLARRLLRLVMRMLRMALLVARLVVGANDRRATRREELALVTTDGIDLDPPDVPSRPRGWRRALAYVHKPLMFCDFYVRAFRVARDATPDAVHAHDLNTLPVAAAVAWAEGAELVYDAHELYTEVSTLSSRERVIWRRIERALISRADHVLTVCDSIADELATRYRIARPEVLLNCPPLDFSVQLSRERLLHRRVGLDDTSEPIILYQGGFIPHRGLEELVESAAHVERGVLVLMGSGVLEARLSQLIAARGLSDAVRLTAPVPPDQLLSHTVDADVGVIPYQAVGLNNFYTTPNKLFEYMAAGVPVTASRFPELVRFVEGLGVGRTFDPRDPRAIAEAINVVLADEATHAAMRERARTAGRRFTWEQQVAPLLAIYSNGDRRS